MNKVKEATNRLPGDAALLSETIHLSTADQSQPMGGGVFKIRADLLKDTNKVASLRGKNTLKQKSRTLPRLQN